MPEIDASESRLKNTLFIRNVQYPDGTTQDWTVPPFSRETENSFRNWMEADYDRQKANQQALRSGTRPTLKLKSEVWGELLALAVKDPPLDLEFLINTFDALSLEDWGRAVQDFFLMRQLPAVESNPGNETPTKSPNPSSPTTT